MTVANIRDVVKYRKGKDIWLLPNWRHSLANRVFPLLTYSEGQLRQIGSGFMISRLGIYFTAQHVIDELYEYKQSDCLTSQNPRIKSRLGNTKAGTKEASPLMGVTIQHRTSVSKGRVAVGDAGTLVAIEPTDLGIVTLQNTHPNDGKQHVWDSLPLSPMIPKIGETVYCVGYTNDQAVLDFSVDDFQKFRRLDIMNKLRPNFVVSSGEVTEVYTEKYASKFGEGPCFQIACQLQGGQSGGPVINSSGYVCGINSSTSFADENSCIAAAIWPSLARPFNLHRNIAKKHKTPITVSLLQLADKGFIDMDDSLKNRVEYRGANGIIEIMPLEAAMHLYENQSIEMSAKVSERVAIPAEVVTDLSKSNL